MIIDRDFVAFAASIKRDKGDVGEGVLASGPGIFYRPFLGRERSGMLFIFSPAFSGISVVLHIAGRGVKPGAEIVDPDARLGAQHGSRGISGTSGNFSSRYSSMIADS